MSSYSPLSPRDTNLRRYAARRFVLKALVLICSALIVVATIGFWKPFEQAPQSEAEVPAAEISLSKPLSDDNRSEVERLEQQMADCDRDAKGDLESLHLLLIPIRPNTDVARKTTPPGETYSGFFLVDSEPTIAGLRDGSYSVNSWPFEFAIVDPASQKIRRWDLVAGITRLTHKEPGAFKQFRLGFGVVGPSNKMQWSNEYTRTQGLCYWVNVRFR